MTDRPTAATITDQQLAALYADADRSEEAIGDLNEHVINFQRRAERAEAAIGRVHDELADCEDDDWMVRAGDIRDALKPTLPSEQPAPAVPAAPEHVDWQGVLRGFQALLAAFPADLHPSGPAVTCRPQPAGLVARWRQHVQAAREQYANQTTKEN